MPRDTPENSRVFVVATSGVTENDIRTAFEPFGTVEDVWFIKTRRQTSEATSNNGVLVVSTHYRLRYSLMFIIHADGARGGGGGYLSPLRVQKNVTGQRFLED